METILTPAQASASSTSSSFSHSVHYTTPPPLDERGAAAFPVAGGGSLGTNAKYSAIQHRGGLEADKAFDLMAARVARFALQSVARKFLPDSRTNNCLRLRTFAREIQVIRSKEYKTASYLGLQTCGSVWACPVCAAKIAERRRVEIQAAMACHKAQGGAVYLLTLTTPHQRTDNLRELLEMQATALKYFKKDFTVCAIFKEMGIIGQIRALEVTHGRKSRTNNGWHPHYHNLLFGSVHLANDYTREGMADRLHVRWAACCVRAGLGEPSRLHGIKLDDGNKAAKYVSKWGLEDEMTKGHTKRALHGETPFDFLRSYLADSKDKQAGALFREFAETFKGKRQLHWSAGLKKRFGIGEVSDEELNARHEDDAEFLIGISLNQWKEVLRVDGRGELLHGAAKCGRSWLVDYLQVMQERYEARHRAESLTMFEEVTAGWSAEMKAEFQKSINERKNNEN